MHGERNDRSPASNAMGSARYSCPFPMSSPISGTLVGLGECVLDESRENVRVFHQTEDACSNPALLVDD